MKKILFIIGSLRKESFNKKLAEEVEQMLTGRATVEYLDYSDVPMMNQDIEFPAPEAVMRVRERVAEADALWVAACLSCGLGHFFADARDIFCNGAHLPTTFPSYRFFA